MLSLLYALVKLLFWKVNTHTRVLHVLDHVPFVLNYCRCVLSEVLHLQCLYDAPISDSFSRLICGTWGRQRLGQPPHDITSQMHVHSA